MTPSADATVRELQPADCVVRIDLGSRLRLAEMVEVERWIRRAMQGEPIRVVLDARTLESMSPGAHMALVSTTARLERAGVELVVERCRPSVRHG